MKIEKIQKIF